jgi:hypothetical protein
VILMVWRASWVSSLDSKLARGHTISSSAKHG